MDDKKLGCFQDVTKALNGTEKRKNQTREAILI